MGLVEKLAFCHSRFSTCESEAGPSFGNVTMSHEYVILSSGFAMQVVALMAGLMYFQADYDQKRIHKISCALWFVVLQLSMSSVTAVHEVN